MGWTIKCIKCGNDFEQQKNERTCGCRPSKLKKRQHYPQNHRIFFNYIGSIRRYYDNVIYQFINEFITTEGYTHVKSIYHQANEFGCECNLSLNVNEPPHDSSICLCECHY